MRDLRTGLAMAGYVAAVIAANVLTSRYGMVPVGLGLTVTAGTYAAGAALLARDVVQDTAGRRRVLLAIAAAGLLSWATASPAIALASTVAFTIAELLDMAIYTPLRRRGWARAVIVSNTVGGLADTAVFLTLARLPLTPGSLTGQMVGKVAWATLLPVAAVTLARRALPHDALDAAGA
jgi:uncharacterized PurR-regulated membrane protein YhhQ (DUF165 family)